MSRRRLERTTSILSQLEGGLAHNVMLLEQLRLLQRLIYEAADPLACSVVLRDEGEISFFAKKSGRISRGEGIHDAAMPALPFALGIWVDELAGKKTLDTGIRIPHDFNIRISDFGSIDKIRNKLLEYELGRFLISRQNYVHFTKYGIFHPLSHKGATDTENLCVESEYFLEGLRVGVSSNQERVSIILTGFPPNVEDNFDDIFPGGVQLSDEAAGLALKLSQREVFKMLQDLEERKVNYQGVIPVDENGGIFMALRKNPGQLHSLGYATCGGHCNDPYHPQVAAAADLQDEFGLALKEEAKDLACFRVISKVNDIMVFAIDAKHFHAERFDPKEREFVKGSAEILSFKEMRDRKIPLRNIPSIDLYLKNCEVRLSIQNIVTKLGIKKILVPSECEVAESKVVQFPKKDFGAIEFYADDLPVLKQELEKVFGGIAQINEEKKCVVIDDVNPQQILDVLGGVKTKEQLDQYRQEQAQKAKEREAAIKIQTAVKQHLTRRDLQGGIESLNIREYSAHNLKEIRDRLRAGNTNMDIVHHGSSAKKEPGKIFSEAEKKLFETFCAMQFYIYHCTYDEAALAVENSATILASPELISRNISTPDDEGNRSAYRTVGMNRNIFFTIGTKSAMSPYFYDDHNFMFRASLNSLLQDDNEFRNGAWMSETLMRFFSGSEPTERKIGTVKYEISHPGFPGGQKVYTYSEGERETVSLSSLGADICVAKDMVKFLGYSFVERLRHLQGSARQYLIANPTDEITVAKVADEMLFSDYNFALHVPTKFEINNPKAKVERFNAQDAMEIKARVLIAAANGEIAELERLKAIHPDLRYQCSLARSIEEKCDEPATATVKTGEVESIKWLAKNGFFDEIVAECNMSGSIGRPSEKMKDLTSALLACRRRSLKKVNQVIDTLFEEGVLSERSTPYMRTYEDVMQVYFDVRRERFESGKRVDGLNMPSGSFSAVATSSLGNVPKTTDKTR